MIIPLEPLAPQEILLVSKIPTGVSLFLGTKASVTPERWIPRKSHMKSSSMLPPRKDSIPNKYSNRFITQQDPILPPLFAKVPTGHKSIIGDTHFSNKI